MGDPPYARIVAALREQIEAGELAPGDRVPSTREITRRWGVAMATATKALTALRQAGLVKAVPGIGTVVEHSRRPTAEPAPHRRRTPSDSTPGRDGREITPGRDGRETTPGRDGRETTLTTERIVAAAMAVADAEGINAASMRRVAADLGVATMSLYRHVADKDDLLMHMMDAALREWRFPDQPPDGWRARLELAGRMLWRTFVAHPWLASTLSLTRPQPVAGGLAYTEWVIATLDEAGLDLSTTFTAHITLFNYVRGTAVNLELEAEAEATTGMDNEEWMDTQESALRRIIATGDFPMFERVATAEYDFDLDNLFEFGMQRLLDGMAVLINGATGPA
ncbi:MAG TPA: TetR/AcrR family transcriptional regulator C-terminal domain-containing protein [Pseudonocardiaceae bacterium]